MTTNKFGFQIPEIKEILANQNTRKFIRGTLISIFGALEIDKREDLVEEFLQLGKSYPSISDYERKAYMLFAKVQAAEKIGQKLSYRADIIYSQIQKYLDGEVLDFGCGDGKVGNKVSKISRLKTTLTDIYKHKNIDEIGLKFVLGTRNKVPLTKKFGTVLLLTVLHHSNDPIKTLLEAKRLTKPGGQTM